MPLPPRTRQRCCPLCSSLIPASHEETGRASRQIAFSVRIDRFGLERRYSYKTTSHRTYTHS
jgi:hypothetical protein